jgi:Mce-associated membrane protein
MPPTRRRPIPAPAPVRRARVAGLRHPEAPHRPVDSSVEDTQVIPAVPAVTDAPPSAPKAEPKPRPTGKARPKPITTPVAWTEAPEPEFEPAVPEPAAPEQGEPAFVTFAGSDMAVAEPGTAEPRRQRTLVLPIVLAAVAVLIGGLASWFGVQWSHARSTVANTALVDTAGTAEVSGEVVTAVNTILSYNYTNMQKTENAVGRLLTGKALCQYNLLYKVVKQQAPSQKLVLTTTVQAKGVEMLQGDTARVLLLVQQTDTRASTNQTSTSQSMIAVNTVKQGGTWKISNIDTFNGDNTTPGC